MTWAEALTGAGHEVSVCDFEDCYEGGGPQRIVVQLAGRDVDLDLRFPAILDTGAHYSIFPRELAESFMEPELYGSHSLMVRGEKRYGHLARVKFGLVGRVSTVEIEAVAFLLDDESVGGCPNIVGYGRCLEFFRWAVLPRENCILFEAEAS